MILADLAARIYIDDRPLRCFFSKGLPALSKSVRAAYISCVGLTLGYGDKRPS